MTTLARRIVAQYSDSVEVTKSKARFNDLEKAYDDLKELKAKAESANPSAQKKFDRAYDKLYSLGDTGAKAVEKAMKKVEGDVSTLLKYALVDWNRNKSDHFRAKEEFTHKKLLQAGQTWGYASKLVSAY